MNNGRVKVGDKLIKNSKVYRIFKIKKKKTNGETKKIAFFRPFFKKGVYSSVISSIPIQNLDIANIRKPASKKKIKKAKKILQNDKYSQKSNLKTLKSKFNENVITETAKVAKHLWSEKQNREKLPPTKKKLYKKTMRGLSEEFALVTDRKLSKARNFIEKKLKS